MAVEPLRLTFRQQVRDHTLDAAYRLAVEQGWDQVRVGAIAEQIGVSRPTLYREFGNKEGIGEALVLREADQFLTAVRDTLTREDDDLGGAIAAAIRLTLTLGTENPLLHAMLTASRSGGDSLLPFLTSRSQPLLTAATTMLRTWFAERHPELDQAVVADAVDAVVRLVVSHLVLATDDIDETARKVALLATRYVGLPDSPKLTAR
jgi:AcrR family transcriptional regulator